MSERDDLARLLAVTSVHHPMFCDCDVDVRCDGLGEQVDAILAAGWVGPAENERTVARALARRLSIVRAERDALAATVARVRALADEWEAEADEDEDWLNGPRVAVSEAQQYPATIRTTRGHVSDLRAALAVMPFIVGYGLMAWRKGKRG